MRRFTLTKAAASERIALLVAILGSIALVGPVTIDLYLPAFPELVDALDTPQSTVYVTLTGFFLGLAVGQAVLGPLSDSLGRRRPMLVGLAAYSVASMVCALAPTIEVLIVARFAQGIFAAAGTVLIHALIRDLFEGPMVAKTLSRMALILGAAPILAPVLGGQLLRITDWRGLFWVLAAFGMVVTGLVAVLVTETLPPERRQRGDPVGLVRSYRQVLVHRRFLAYGAMILLVFFALFGYISGASFAYQDVYQVSPQAFGPLLGATAVVMVLGNQLNARLLARLTPALILARALPVAAVATLVLLATTATGAFGVAGLLLPSLIVMGSLGFVVPNGMAMALQQHPQAAGTAASLLGVGQFTIGATAGPIIGWLEAGAAWPMALVMAVGTIGAAAIALMLAGPRRAVPSTDQSRYG